MNENTAKPAKKKLKPNVIDLIIVLVILGTILSMLFRQEEVVNVIVQEERSLESAQISFLILDINDNSGNYFNIGDNFYSPALVMDVGKLSSVQIMPAEAFIADENGQLNKTYSSNGRIDVRGTIDCQGLFSEEGFLLGGSMYLAPGSSVHVQSPGIDVTFTITDITKMESAS